ncbi:MAG: hypothetical protein RLZZ230_407 [Candidatus Parcubacteria bacterium]|jgi:hypothetical protein
MKIIIVLLVLSVSFPVFALDNGTVRGIFGSDKSVDYTQVKKDKGGLYEHQKKMKQLHKKISKQDGQDYLSTITFENPLLKGEAIDIVERSEAKVKFTYVLAKSTVDNELVTIGIYSNNEDINLYQETLNESLKNAESDKDIQILGITAIVGHVPAKRIDPLQTDSHVFLVDVTADRKISNAKGYRHHFGWDLYHQ